MTVEKLEIGNGIPHGPGMGVINGTNIERIRGLLDSALLSPAGLVNLGSIGSRYNEGNRGETYFHDPVTGETVNSMGLPGIGIDQAEPLIAEYAPMFKDVGMVLKVGVTPLRGEDASKVLPELMERIMLAGAHEGEANYSCPNIVIAGGGRKPILGFDPEAMIHTRQAIVNAVGPNVRWWEKLPPYLGDNEHLIAEIAATYGVDQRLGRLGVTLFNTIPNATLEREGRPVLRVVADVDGEEVVTHAGGMSGPAVADIYQGLQNQFLHYLPLDVPVIAAGGIWDGWKARGRYNDSRVQATEGVSRYFEGERTGSTIGRVATRFAEEFLEQ